MSEKMKFKQGDEVHLKEPGIVSEVATDSGKVRCRVEWPNANYDWHDANELTIKDPKAAIEAAREALKHIRDFAKEHCETQCIPLYGKYGRHATDCPREYLLTADKALALLNG